MKVRLKIVLAALFVPIILCIIAFAIIFLQFKNTNKKIAASIEQAEYNYLEIKNLMFTKEHQDEFMRFSKYLLSIQFQDTSDDCISVTIYPDKYVYGINTELYNFKADTGIYKEFDTDLMLIKDFSDWIEITRTESNSIIEYRSPYNKDHIYQKVIFNSLSYEYDPKTYINENLIAYTYKMVSPPITILGHA